MTSEIIEKPMSAECTMKQYEEIPDADFVENREYQLTDYPDNGANAEQMAYALTCQRLFPAGTVVTFSGVTDSNYTNGHLYQIEVDKSGVKSWKDITPVGEQSIITLVGTQDNPITPDMLDDETKLYLLKGYIYINEDFTKLKISDAIGSILARMRITTNQSKSYIFYNAMIDERVPAIISNANTAFSIYPAYSAGGISAFDAGDIRIGWTLSSINGLVLKNPSKINSIYVPFSSGNEGQILQSNGFGSEPTWIDLPTSTTVDTELADSENLVQNKAIFNALKDKLGVLGPDEHNRVYIRKDNTTDSSLPFSYTAEADSIMKRNASGQVQVATPTQDEDAVNKSYADQLQRYLSLSGDSGTLEEDQYELVKNNDNLIIQRVGLDFRRCGYPSNGQGDYIFFCDHYTKPNGSEDWLDYFITIKQDKTWETTIKNHLQVASQTYAPFVQLSPDTATNGNLTDDDYTNLTEHDDVYIILNNEYYRKADNQHTTGIISYTHQGWNGDTPQDKSINITVATKAWTLVVGKTKYYRHYVQLTSDSKALYYDFSSTQETAYTADTLPSMPDDIITAFQVVANGYYSAVSGLVYRNSEGALKVIMHGMYTTDGTNMTYLQLTGTDATFVQDIVKTM